MPPWHRAQDRCVFNLVVWKSIQARLFAPASRKAWCKYTRELSLSTVQKTGLPHQAQTENICSSSPRKRISKCVLPLPPHPLPIQWRKPSPCLPSGFSTITPPPARRSPFPSPCPESHSLYMDNCQHPLHSSTQQPYCYSYAGYSPCWWLLSWCKRHIV